MSLVVIPSIDLRGGQVVRLKQGDYTRQINYDVDPVQTARSFASAGARWLHVVDLDGARDGRPVQNDIIARIIHQSGLQVEVGGGVRSTDHVRQWLDAGASRVVIGTKAIEDWPWFESLAHDPSYSGRLVLALDAKGGWVATRGWTVTSTTRAVDIAAKISGWPVGAILYTDVARDGMMTGVNVEATAELAAAGNVPVIASGGVGTIDHVHRLKRTGVWGVIVGRALYEGTVDLAEALRMAADDNPAG